MYNTPFVVDGAFDVIIVLYLYVRNIIRFAYVSVEWQEYFLKRITMNNGVLMNGCFFISSSIRLYGFYWFNESKSRAIFMNL